MGGVVSAQSAEEWAASLSVADVDRIINRCVQTKDFRGLKAALHLMAVKDPDRASHWREVLLLGVALGRARIAAEEPSPRLEQWDRGWRVYCPDCAWSSKSLPFPDPDAALHCLTLHKVLCAVNPS